MTFWPSHPSKRRSSFWLSALVAGAASSISLIGGLSIELVAERLLPVVPLLIATPALNNMVGDYAAIIAAHIGDPAGRERSRRDLLKLLARVVLVNVVGLLILSLLLAHSRGYISSPDFVLKFGLFIAGVFAFMILSMFAISIWLERLVTRRNLDPDELLIPVVTSITDVAVLSLVAVGALILF